MGAQRTRATTFPGASVPDENSREASGLERSEQRVQGLERGRAGRRVGWEGREPGQTALVVDAPSLDAPSLDAPSLGPRSLGMGTHRPCQRGTYIGLPTGEGRGGVARSAATRWGGEVHGAERRRACSGGTGDGRAWVAARTAARREQGHVRRWRTGLRRASRPRPPHVSAEQSVDRPGTQRGKGRWG